MPPAGVAGHPEARRKRETNMKTYNHYIGGQWVEPAQQRWIDSIDPYQGKPWARIAQGCAQDVDRAVAAASKALREGPWATMLPTERGKLMVRLAELVTKNADRLAEVEVRDNGKLMAEMRGQLNYLGEWWRYFGGLADKIEQAVDALTFAAGSSGFAFVDIRPRYTPNRTTRHRKHDLCGKPRKRWG